MTKTFKVQSKSETLSGTVPVTSVQLAEEEGTAVLQLFNLSAADAAELQVGKSYTLTISKPAAGK